MTLWRERRDREQKNGRQQGIPLPANLPSEDLSGLDGMLREEQQTEKKNLQESEEEIYFPGKKKKKQEKVRNGLSMLDRARSNGQVLCQTGLWADLLFKNEIFASSQA